MDVCSQVAVALDWLHARQVAHRDLKLENVLCRDDGATYVLCDFGSATTAVLPAERSRKAMLQEQEKIERYSTQMYRAPEMVDLHRNWPVDERVDVWALGCLVYELLHGHPPYYVRAQQSGSNRAVA